MDSESAQNEWELSKENVQPLRTGRKVQSLNESLAQSSDLMSRIREEKRVFEAELRTYTGDDPLDTWYRYIRWTEEVFPKGGKDSNLTTILQQCVKQYKDDKKYHNDERYIYAWMRMADVCNDPLEIYTFMYDQNIGCELSAFYDGWASVYEQLGDTKRADAVYQNGLGKFAQPVEMLQRKHEEFQKRVARGILRGGGEEEGEDEDGAQRQVLCQLKTHGARSQVPVVRVGGAIKGAAGMISGGQPKSSGNQQPGASSGKGIQIYCDENQTPGALPPQTGKFSTVPSRTVTNKENEKKAGVWKNQKVKTTGGIKVPISEVNSYQQPKFSVHVDEDDAMPALRTPAKMPEMGNQVLSARKGDSGTMSNYLKTMSAATATTEANKSEKAMYCKEKIYCGAEEYSFEEIRAVHWARKQEDQRREAEVKEYHDRLEAERVKLLEETEKIRQQRLQLQQEEQAMLQEASRKRQQHLTQMEQDREAELQRQEQLVEASIQKRLLEQAQMAHTAPNKSVRQLFDDSGQGSTENLLSQVKAYSMATSSQQGRHNSSSSAMATASQQGRHNSSSSAMANHSLNSSRGTPNSQSFNTSQPRSTEKIGAPSPTVHMKEAMNIVLGMFNTSLEMNKQQREEEEDNRMDESSLHTHRPAAGGAVPFSIFCDEGQENAGAQSAPAPAPAPASMPAPAPAPFKIFEESEANEDALMLSEKKQAPPSGLRFRGAGDQLQHAPSGHQDKHDVVMEESIRSSATRQLFDEDNIESHARDDITLAPVGSHLSFAAQAKIASTPFQPNLSSGNRSRSPLDLSDIEMSEPPVVEKKSVSPEKSKESLEQSAGNASNTSSSFRNNLSPIMEGSSEDSGAHSKSSNHTTQQSALEPHAPAQFALTPVQDVTDDTLSLLQPFEENNQSTHVIDTSAYVPPEMDEKTANLLSMSVCIVDPEDPFDTATKEGFLRTLEKPLVHYDSYNVVDDFMPEIKKGSTLYLGMDTYNVLAKLGEGGFATVYLANSEDLDMMTTMVSDEQTKMVAIKVETPPQKWEFYICSVLHERLAALHDTFDARPSMMEISSGYFFSNTSCLVTDFQQYGTILEFINKLKSARSVSLLEQLEPAVMYMTIELLHMVENLHRCHIIHGDIKPDNFLILQLPQLPVSSDPDEVFRGGNRCFQLIDFGQGIDMSRYPAGTTFLAKVHTNCFQCIEMKTNRPWTYQTDLFGLAGTIHVLVFQQYMKVYQTRGEWKMTSSFPRKWNNELWKQLFQVLLNVPSCDQLPDISAVRRKFERHFVDNFLHQYNQQSSMLSKTLMDCAKKFH